MTDAMEKNRFNTNISRKLSAFLFAEQPRGKRRNYQGIQDCGKQQKENTEDSANTINTILT